MSSGKNPLMLMMALTMPGAAHALGLGDIHVDSALNERFAAEIDLVGATALELIDLRAAVANRETFLRFGADRPAFLSSTTFKVTQDAQGRPVLAVRSTESFTEPFVNFLVELRWGKGELLRQYTLLLDPPGFPLANRAVEVNRTADAARIADTASTPRGPAAPDVPAAPPAATPIVETKTQTVARQVDPPIDRPDSTRTDAPDRKTTHIKVGARATLRGIAWRVGERSDSDLQRMMIAIFRANPTAFDGNINRLYRGAVLTIPSHSELEAISRAEAKREFHAQMSAWHAPVRAVAASSAMPLRPVDAPPALATAVDAQPAGAAPRAAPALASPATDALDHRVQSLEQELNEMKGLLQSENEQLLSLRQQAARGENPAAIEAPRPVSAQAQSKSRYPALVPMLAGLGILASAFAALYFGLRRRLPTLKDLRSGAAVAAQASGDAAADDDMADTVVNVPEDEWQAPAKDLPHERLQESEPDQPYDGTETDVLPIPATGVDETTQPSLPVVAPKPADFGEIAADVLLRPAPHETTVNLRVDAAKLRMDQTRLDYNLLDLDLTTQHVHLPSVLNEPTAMKERRTNLADVLLLAIEREPDRHDLRMKLLELYYSAAATNRQAFLEVVQKFARDRNHLQPDQWDKIARMGRQIASENPLFAEEPVAEDDLANCA